MTEADHATSMFINAFCRKRGIKFICSDCRGVFSRVFNDFGDQFEILDKNGEDLQDTMIQSISNEEAGLVELLQNQKHKLEDGDEVLIQEVEGMELKEGEKHDDALVKSNSINDTIHKVTVLTPYSFKIGNTTKFENHKRGGMAKQLKSKVQMKFKSFKDTAMAVTQDILLDGDLAIADFEKMQNSLPAHICFLAYDQFKTDHKRVPKVWDLKDAKLFVDIARSIAKEAKVAEDDLKDDSMMVKIFYLFCFQSQGVFNPLCAFQGGFVAQECIKAITQKFSPTRQLFYYDASEVLPDFKLEDYLKEGQLIDDKDLALIRKTQVKGDRSDGLRIVLG
jgi:ubiquitin-activating enzyme E1